MQTDSKPAPATIPNGHTWTDASGLPRATNGAWTQEQTVNPAAPVMATPATPEPLGPSEQAAEDWRQIKCYGADQVSLRTRAAARFNALELTVYQHTLSDLRRLDRPATPRAQTTRQWNRGTMQRKAA